MDRDGKRKAIRLRKVTRKDAETVGSRIDDIVSASILGKSLSREVASGLRTSARSFTPS
jgi:hypothetical protein